MHQDSSIRTKPDEKMEKIVKITVPILVVIIVYYLLGAMLFAPLLVPVGCSGSLGDADPVKSPTTEFNISYEPSTQTVSVEHVGGDTLFDNSTNKLVVEVESDQENQRFDWVTLGGAYPVRAGDEVSIQESIDDNMNTIVRVVWSGSAQVPAYPFYCPGSGEAPTITITLTRSEIR
jgi:hypothetical protein